VQQCIEVHRNAGAIKQSLSLANEAGGILKASSPIDLDQIPLQPQDRPPDALPSSIAMDILVHGQRLILGSAVSNVTENAG
jgi:hypothetical protein